MQNLFARPPTERVLKHPAVLDGAALACGALATLAFAPFGLFPLAWLCAAALFLIWRGATPARAAWRGFLFGCGLFGAGVSWVYVSLHDFGNMPPVLAATTVVLFVALLALYPAAVGGLYARFLRPAGALGLALALPALWVLVEWLRGWFLSGFPWLNLGYSQIDTPLAGLAPVFGVHGVSLAAAATAALIAAVVTDRRRAVRLYLPVLAVLWFTAWAVGRADWVEPEGEPLAAGIVQGNTPLALKWRPEYREAILENHVLLSAQLARAKLIVWPEAAVPVYFDEADTALLAPIRAHARARGVDYIIGIIERGASRREYFNSAVVIGAKTASYRKRHLVPFGEFLPLKPLFGWLIDYLKIPMSDFSAGAREQRALAVAGVRAAVSICYEDAFGAELIDPLPEATVLVNLSEDSWFGDSLAPHQRLQMARMRTLEAGRPMLRAANTGPSAAIDHRGVVLARSRQFRPQQLEVSVQPMRGRTPYVRWGNAPILILAFGMLGLTAVQYRRFREPRVT